MKLPTTRLPIPSRAAIGWATALLLLLGAQAPGQAFHVRGGASTAFDAQGGSVDFSAPGYEGWMGLGFIDGELTLGASATTQIGNYKVTAGDDVVPFSLPTDVFNTSYYFLARGLGLEGKAAGGDFTLLTGVSTFGVGTSFFRGARRDRALGALFFDRQLSPQLRLVARNVFSDRQTSIGGAEYIFNDWLTGAVSGGVGGNEGFFSSSLVAEKPWVTLKAAMISAGDGFRRVDVRAPLATEYDGENILATLRPMSNLTVTVGRQNLLSPSGLDVESGLRARVDSASASGRFAGLSLNGGVYQSQVEERENRAFSLGARRRVWRNVDAGFTYFNSSSEQQTTDMLGFDVRERISRRISLSQHLNRSEDHTSLAFGGDLHARRFSVGVSYNTVYAPFREGSPLIQAMAVNVHTRPFGGFELQGSTFVAPDGQMRFTISASDWLYRYRGLEGGGRSGPRMGKYVVRGRVTDDEGNPISGAALQVGGQIVFTDSKGLFFVRVEDDVEYPFAVMLREFLDPGFYEVVSAPESVLGKKPDAAGEVHVVVRRVSRQTFNRDLPPGSASPQPMAEETKDRPWYDPSSLKDLNVKGLKDVFLKLKPKFGK